MNLDKEMIALPNTILKIDNNHFGINKILENKELFSKSKLELVDIKNMMALDYEKRWQYKIILEGGLLLCQLREIHKERNHLTKYIKAFIKKEVKNRHGDLGELEGLVQNIIPFKRINEEEDGESPLVQILIDSLYKEIKKVKEAFQEARERAFQAEE